MEERKLELLESCCKTSISYTHNHHIDATQDYKWVGSGKPIILEGTVPESCLNDFEKLLKELGDEQLLTCKSVCLMLLIHGYAAADFLMAVQNKDFVEKYRFEDNTSRR